MERQVVLKIRIAKNTDFSDQFGNKKIGTVYFCENSKGIVEEKINYLTIDTDMFTFKQLYANNQIYVFINPFEVVEIYK
jgi:hypothetical protein